MPEAAQLGFGSEEMTSPSSSAAGDAEALATEVVDLKLDDGERRGGGEDGDGDSGRLVPPVEGEEGGRPAEGEARTVDVSHQYVSGKEAVAGAEEAEMDKAWRGQEDWMKEREVAEDGAAQEDEKGATHENGEEKGGDKSPHPQRPSEPDCAYYVRTGHCAFGAKCKFNHPLLRGKRVLVVKSSDSEKPHVNSSEGEKSQALPGLFLGLPWVPPSASCALTGFGYFGYRELDPLAEYRSG
ncbi:hypothetical protein Taro_050542 [Colocasia esculenta]|uniref:C3H1-type domain-containing protein n=1 Tax=Colocasia esculenta TaxID=4460 RepID=A0A843XEB2_COLES|nr:hypothetical protein [Colocasia esculenta]